jgi:hAT family C-terminal dimerisation region
MSSSDSISFDNRESSIDISTETLPEPISTSVNQSTPRRKRARTAKGTWEHSRKPLDSEPERGGPKKNLLHYCKYCTSPSYSTYVSTTFRNHLMKVHSIEADRATVHPIKKARVSLLREAFAKAGQNDTTKLNANEHRILENALDKVAVLEALVQLVTVRNLPYNCSQWPELHALLMAVNPTAENVINLSHGSVQRLVSNSYFIHKDILQKKLQSSLSKLHLSVDVWSAPNHKAFLGTCVQFVEEGTKEIRQALLALPELPGLDGPGSHSGAEQWKLLQSVLEDYDIWQRVGYVTGDNHGSNDVLCRELSEFLRSKDQNWPAKHHRVRCHGHVINLIVQAFLFMDSKEAVEEACTQIENLDGASYDMDMIEAWKRNKDLGWRQMGPLGKVHNTAVHIRSDNHRYNQFKKRAGRVLGLDNDTRWNSWFLLLNVTLEKQEHVKWYQDRHWDSLKDDYLTPEDWQTLHDTRDFLQPFWKITRLTEGHRTTLDSTLFTMDVLHKHYQQAFIKFRNKQQILGCILTSWHIFDKYYQLSDESPVYAAALILHPSRRKAHILKNWPRSWHKTVFNSVKKLWEDSYKELPSENPLSLFQSEPIPDEYELLARELDVVGANSDIDEYETFTSQVPISIDCSPLIWWLRDEQQSHYPGLSKMAIDILSIPAMSADPERVFSGARRTISWDRMQLGASVIERGECLKSWIRSGITRGLPAEMIDEYLEET